MSAGKKNQKCPKCGGISGFRMSQKCNGWWKSLHTWDGTTTDTDLDSVRYGAPPKTVVCVDCGARVARPTEGLAIF